MLTSQSFQAAIFHKVGKIGQFREIYCKIVVETPVNLTEHQKDLLKQFEASINGEEEVESKSKDDDSASAKSKEKKQTVKTSHKPKADKFFDGVKKFFKDLSEPEKK